MKHYLLPIQLTFIEEFSHLKYDYLSTKSEKKVKELNANSVTFHIPALQLYLLQQVQNLHTKGTRVSKSSDTNIISEKYTLHLLIEHLNIPHTKPNHFFYTLKDRQHYEMYISRARGRPSTPKVLNKLRQPIKQLAAARLILSQQQPATVLSTSIKHKLSKRGKYSCWQSIKNDINLKVGQQRINLIIFHRLISLLKWTANSTKVFLLHLILIYILIILHTT